MERNVGRTDRNARIAAGSALVGAGLLAGPKAPAKSAAAAGVGSVMVATAATGRCPAYELAGIDTLEG
ncbi:YgaP family membrane protein [Halapricum desulfuricans]|uniref:DUF2892 family n=1 Tax=Halapricum desulfuricans TaxID=2841257 RepID=A0A897N4V1_9EURY|nr:DUF2892 domain-containing protein [Halapricum desulfuricans]QSG06283.1 DUF2892 family [Halapricum desulfuricans]